MRLLFEKGGEMNCLDCGQEINDDFVHVCPVDLKWLDERLDYFAKDMKTKLHKKAEQGYYGWDCDELKESFHNEIILHFLKYIKTGDKSQLIDIANFCMFLYKD
jgi:hypothetical protein